MGGRRLPDIIYLHPQVPGSLQKEFLAQVVAQTHATLGHCTHISIIAISVSVPHDAPAAPLANTFSQLLLSPGDYWGWMGDSCLCKWIVIWTGFIPKNPFQIHKLFTNLCTRVQKSNTKVRNAAACPVKGRNPYYSRWPTHSISQNWQELCSLWFRTGIFFIFFNYCSVLGNAASDWSAESFSLALTLKTTKFTNFHRPHSVFTDFQGLEKIIPFSKNFQRPSKSMRTLLERMRTCAACAMFYYIIRFYGYYIIRFYGRLCKVHNGLIKLDLVTVFSTVGVPHYKESDMQDMLVLPWLMYSCALLDLVLICCLLMPMKHNVDKVCNNPHSTLFSQSITHPLMYLLSFSLNQRGGHSFNFKVSQTLKEQY